MFLLITDTDVSKIKRFLKLENDVKLIVQMDGETEF